MGVIILINQLSYTILAIDQRRQAPGIRVAGGPAKFFQHLGDATKTRKSCHGDKPKNDIRWKTTIYSNSGYGMAKSLGVFYQVVSLWYRFT